MSLEMIAGRKVRILVPQRGEKRGLVDLATRNAALAYQNRYNPGTSAEYDALETLRVVLAFGLFAMAEVFRGLEEVHKGTAPDMIKISGKLWLTKEEWTRSIGPIWRGGIIGFIARVGLDKFDAKRAGAEAPDPAAA